MDFKQLEDRQNDWLAKELRKENLTLKHCEICEAREVREEHEAFHQSQDKFQEFTKAIKPTSNKGNSIIKTILIFYIVWALISILITVLGGLL